MKRGKIFMTKKMILEMMYDIFKQFGFAAVADVGGTPSKFMDLLNERNEVYQFEFKKTETGLTYYIITTLKD
jgi:hypothetical protein